MFVFVSVFFLFSVLVFELFTGKGSKGGTFERQHEHFSTFLVNFLSTVCLVHYFSKPEGGDFLFLLFVLIF